MASTPVDPVVQLGKNPKKRISGKEPSVDPAKPRKKPKLNRHSFSICMLLLSCSHAAFKSPFFEGQTQTYSLEDIDTTAFRMLVHWLYTQKLDLILEEVEDPLALDDTATLEDLAEEEDQVRERVSAHEVHLVQLWIAADRLLMPTLQNAAIEALVEVWGVNEECILGFGWIKYAYEHTQPYSPLRYLAIDTFTNMTSSRTWLTFKANSYHLLKEFLIDLAVVMSKNIQDAEMGGFHKFKFTRAWKRHHVPVSN